jgi:Nucleotidyl transferase AbiEii toxin, Type IV TA system
VSGPTHADVAGRAYLDLQNTARRQQRPTQELLELYALEGLLVRLAASGHRSALVLKGGMLLAAYGVRRPTRDVDFLANGLANDRDVVLAMLREVAANPMDDGLVFDTWTSSAEVIRDEDEYTGVRVSMRCRLSRAELAFHVDVNVGDPVWPPPGEVEVPGLLGGVVRLLGYPISAVHAEKIVTALQRGTGNTRWRDFADIYLLCAQQDVDGGDLIHALEDVAAHRQVVLAPLSEALEGYAELAQVRWGAWLRRQRLAGRLHGQFAEVLVAVYAFSDPALRAEVAGSRWNQFQSAWTPASPAT